LVDEGSKGQLSDIIEKLTIRQGQVGYDAIFRNSRRGKGNGPND